MLNRILNAFASRPGSILTLGVLLGASVLAGSYFRQTGLAVEANLRFFDERQLRNGFVSMSDIQRLNLVVHDAMRQGTMDEGALDAFRRATDILYVRAENFRRVLGGNTRFPAAEVAIARLERVVAIADAAQADGLSDLPGLSEELIAASQQARESLVQYLDEMRRLQDGLLEQQSAAIEEQRTALSVILAVLTLMGATALVLLRREVLGRRAREQAEERVEYLAFFDNLTGLPNRVQFQDRVEARLATGKPMAVLLADLDEFKGVNDTYGHAAGDAILKHVARVIETESVAAGGFAARLAGDEFAAVIPSENVPELGALCDRIIQAMRSPVDFHGETLRAGISIGVATSTQVQERMQLTLDALVRVTDFALYAAKARGRNRHVLYDTSLETQFLDRRAKLEEMPRAMQDGSIQIYLQPKVHLPGGEVYGFEALARWKRGNTLVQPSEFIQLAEESGLVQALDFHVLTRACAVVAGWNDAHGTAFSVAVNFSAVHFTTMAMVLKVRGVLETSGLDPGSLTVEITESTELRDWDKAGQVVSALRELGCRIAIDDFGTGYSSLAYLRAVDADELKIDRSLVSEIETSEEALFVFDAVVDMAESLRMEAVVEGIETAEQARIVHSLGARRAQGFAFGHPEPAEEALARASRVVAEDAITRGMSPPGAA